MEIPAMPAADWLSVLMVEDMDLDDIFPGFLTDEDEEVVNTMMLTGDLDADEYQDILLSIIETAAARDWWVVFRLVESARRSWDVLGAEMALRGIDATQVSLSSWLDVVLIVLLRAMEPEKVQMFCMKLEAPPVGAEAEEPEMSASDFMAMAN
jgi:hypothetical protein